MHKYYIDAEERHFKTALSCASCSQSKKTMPFWIFLRSLKCIWLPHLFAPTNWGRGPHPQRCSSLAWSSKCLKEKQRSAGETCEAPETGSNSPPSQQFDQNGPRDALASPFPTPAPWPYLARANSSILLITFPIEPLVHSEIICK